MTVLQEILAHKKDEVTSRRRSKSEHSVRREAESLHRQALEELSGSAPDGQGFLSALQQNVEQRGCAVIAEIKKASPSKGLICPDMHPEAVAESYQKGGASALSVLTDERFFQGHDDFLSLARRASGLPVLRKDFMIDPYQIFESRTLGADCVLLIVAALDAGLLREMYAVATTVGLEVLVEVHNEPELERAMDLTPKLLGINNRDLHSFETDLKVSETLRRYIPSDVLVVAESGIHTKEDVSRLQAADIHAFLVGEALMRTKNAGAALHALFYADQDSTRDFQA